jgi:hypothetical protein
MICNPDEPDYLAITPEGSVSLLSDASLMYIEGLGSPRLLLAVKSVWQHYYRNPFIIREAPEAKLSGRPTGSESFG